MVAGANKAQVGCLGLAVQAFLSLSAKGELLGRIPTMSACITVRMAGSAVLCSHNCYHQGSEIIP
jgi:hypothetical protein